MTTWNVPLQLNNLQAQISNQQAIGLTNPLNANVVTNNFSLSGNTAGNPSVVLGGGQEFKVITTDLTPHILVDSGVNGGVQLGLPSGYGGYKVTAPTVVPSATNDTQVATTAFVQSAILATPPGVGVVSITAGTNIGVDITVPTVPVVSVLDPLTSQLNIGTQSLIGSSVVGDDNTTLRAECIGGVSSEFKANYDNALSDQHGEISIETTNTACFGTVAWSDTANGRTNQSLNQSDATNNTLTVSAIDTTNTAQRQDITSTFGIQDSHSYNDGTINSSHQQILNGTGITDATIATGSTTLSSYNETTIPSSASTQLQNQSGLLGTATISNTAVLASATSLLTKTTSGSQTTSCRSRADGTESSLKLELTDTGGLNTILNKHTLTAGGLFTNYEQSVANISGITNNTTFATNATDTALTAGKALTLASTTGNILLSSANIDVDANKIEYTAPLATTTNPMLSLVSTSAVAGTTNGTCVIKTNKTGRNAVSSDIVMSQQYNALNFNGVDTTFGKIECVATTATAGDTDGSLDFYSNINGINQLVFRLNGADNENNSFRPLDLNGNILKTSTGNMSIDTNVSTTAGAVLTLATKSNVAGSGNGLALTGNTLLNASAGGSSGQHLCLTINGTVYKIALLNA